MMEKEKMLVGKLKGIIENKFNVPTGENTNELAKSMLRLIGTTDPYLRDDLIYIVFSKWILTDIYTNEQLRNFLLITVDDDHLFYGLGEENTDSVFTRSFSILIISVILLKHFEKPFLFSTDFGYIKERVFQYAKNEKDIRGYVEGKGWAHSVAHLADCLDEIAKSHESNRRDLLTVLTIIQERVMESMNVYTCEEDERLVTAVMSILDRKIVSNQDFILWCHRFKEYKLTGDYLLDFNIKINTKHFLRSLNYRLKQNNSEIKTEILDTLDEISTF